MNFDGQTPRQNHFSVEVPLNDPGLYFYYFDLYTDFRRIVRGPDNCGVISWQDGESWQITVYEQDFETPESIKARCSIRSSRTASAKGGEQAHALCRPHLSGRQARRALLAAQRGGRPPE